MSRTVVNDAVNEGTFVSRTDIDANTGKRACHLTGKVFELLAVEVNRMLITKLFDDSFESPI